MTTVDCRHLVELATAHLEDGLDRDDGQRVLAHVAGCPGCDQYLGQLRRTIDHLRSVDDVNDAGRRG